MGMCFLFLWRGGGLEEIDQVAGLSQRMKLQNGNGVKKSKRVNLQTPNGHTPKQ